MKLILSLLVAINLVSIYVYAKNITVKIGQDKNSLDSYYDYKNYYVDDETTTLGELANRFLTDNKIQLEDKWKKYLRLETHFGKTVDLDKKLIDIGVNDGDSFKIKWWSRAGDVGVHVLTGAYATGKFLIRDNPTSTWYRGSYTK